MDIDAESYFRRTRNDQTYYRFTENNEIKIK